jgi:hypothetical protein
MRRDPRQGVIARFLPTWHASCSYLRKTGY